MSTSVRRLILGSAGLTAVAFLSGCAKNAPQDTWQPKGPNAQMIEKGEEQILTFRIDKPSIASEKPYKFYVPGVEDQSIEVVVP